eukprot:g1221.t1
MSGNDELRCQLQELEKQRVLDLVREQTQMDALREKLIEERMTRRENEMRLNEKVERAEQKAQEQAQMQALREKLIEERMTRRENEMRLNEKVERARMEAQIKEMSAQAKMEKIEVTMLLRAERGAMLQQMHNLQREPQASNSTASSLQMLEAEQAAGARYHLEQMEMKKAAIANMEQQQLETAEKEAAIARQKAKMQLQKAKMQQELQTQKQVFEAEMEAQQKVLQMETEEATMRKNEQEWALQKPAIPSAAHTLSPTPLPAPAPVPQKSLAAKPAMTTAQPAIATAPVRSIRAKVALPEGMANHFGMRQGIITSGAFILFLSAGILTRPFCRFSMFEIRAAIAHKKPLVLIHESDPRHGSYDFYAEQMAAPDDLKFLTDQHESMAFRRRGYERDALLQAVIARANFKDLVASEEAERGQEQPLATLPEELSHFNLDNFRDREVQADLVALLLLPKSDPSFASCVLVHGMGGTGKTVTAVAVLQEVAVRSFFSDVCWLAVGADAVGERIKELMGTLHKQLTGKSLSSEEALAKNEQDLQQMLVQAMAEKRRALVVLDDPWVPEQVRSLNPIDGSHTQHRLLVTTRMRDLVPKATRVELPLMGEEEAVALLMDLANVEEASYLKDNPGSAWPPQAAFAISAECGLLPITLLIAAQVIRSWGSGWETAVLPLLREERGSGTSTVEERVIGAGLQALEKNEDGSAVKKLFYAFAVTQYLRKRLSAEEMRAEHKKVVVGMAMTAAERARSTGTGLQNTGTTAKAFDGEEIDWYICNVGSFHMSHAIDPSTSPAQSADLRGWLLTEDDVLSHQAAITMGVEGLAVLAAEYVAEGAHFQAAKAKYAASKCDEVASNNRMRAPLLREAHKLLQPITTPESQQLRWDVLSSMAYVLQTIIADFVGSDEQVSMMAELEELGSNATLRRDALAEWGASAAQGIMDTGILAYAYNDGRIIDDDDLHRHLLWSRAVGVPLLRKSRDQAIGARRECFEFLKNMLLATGPAYPHHHNSHSNAVFIRALQTEEWVKDSSGFVSSIKKMNFARHHEVSRRSALQNNGIGHVPSAYFAEKHGDFQVAIDVFCAKRRYMADYISAIEIFGEKDGYEFHDWFVMPHLVGNETAHVYPFRAKILQASQLAGLMEWQDVKERLNQCPLINAMRAGPGKSNDGL